MDNKIINLSHLVDLINYPSDILERVNESLKSIFEADSVCFQKGYIKGNHHGFYLPVMVEGKNIGYYEIIGAKRKILNEDIKVVISLLSQLYTKLNAGNKFKNDENLVHGMNQLGYYQNNLDLKNIFKLNCLFINVCDYQEIVSDYGIDSANYMINIALDVIKKVFNLANDTIFQCDNNQFAIFITNQVDFLIKVRAIELKKILNNDDINITFGLAMAYSDIDLKSLIVLAQQNMCSYSTSFKKHR